MGDQTFRHTHRVTYAECTVGNHIYYARYLDLLEAAKVDPPKPAAPEVKQTFVPLTQLKR
jgi:hypothetical protein